MRNFIIVIVSSTEPNSLIRRRAEQCLGSVEAKLLARWAQIGRLIMTMLEHDHEPRELIIIVIRCCCSCCCTMG